MQIKYCRKEQTFTFCLYNPEHNHILLLLPNKIMFKITKGIDVLFANFAIVYLFFK